MKVIILKSGEVKDVAEGYARNYLFAKKLAIRATDESLKKAEEKRKKIEAEETKNKELEQVTVDKLKDIVVKIQVKTNEEGKLFAALAIKDVLAALKKQYQIEMPAEWIKLDDGIKQVGEYEVKIQTTAGLKGKVKVQLNKEQ